MHICATRAEFGRIDGQRHNSRAWKGMGRTKRRHVSVIIDEFLE